MDSPKQKGSGLEFSVTVFTVKLAVKFPCRMSLHSQGKPITQEVTANSNVFTFNQEVKIKVNNSDEESEINVYLSTQKGGNILAGVINIASSMIFDKEGQKMTLNLKKCLDGSAFCQIQINRVWSKKERINNLARSTVGGSGLYNKADKLQTRKNRNKSGFQFIETKSEYQGNVLKRKNQRLGSPLQSYRYLQKQKFDDFRERLPVPRVNLLNEDKILQDMKETRTLGGGGRFKRQKQKPSLKKPLVSETQNNLKLDVMKYRMKNEELQKGINEKVKTIKENKDQILELERKLLQRQYVQEELLSKQASIKILEDRIANLTSQNSQLRESMADQLKTINEMKDNIRFDLLKNKEDYEKKEHTLKHELSLTKNKINELEMDISNKGGQLAKAKKYIEDLQNSSEQKIFEHDQILQELKRSCSKSIGEYMKKNTDLEQQILDLNKQIETLHNNNNTLAQNLSKKQSLNQSQQSQIHVLQTQKTQLLAFKSDYQILIKKYNKLQQQNKQEHKQHQKNTNTKNKQFSELQQESNKNINGLEGKLHSANEKLKEYKKKISELENAIFMLKNDEEKYKKTIQKLQKSLAAHTDKIDTLEKEVRVSDTKIQSIEKEIQQKANVSVNSQSLFKMQIQHDKQTISRITSELQDIEGKYSNVREQYDNTRAQKTKLQNKIQLLQDNNSRVSEYAKEKKQEIQAKEIQHKQIVKNLNTTIKQLQQSEKSKQKQLNNWEIKELSYKNNIEKLQKNRQELELRIQKIEKGTIPKIQGEKERIIEEKNKYKDKLQQLTQENKFVLNERAKLQSQTNKNSKINTVLNEQKISALNQINKLKNALARSQKKEESLNVELKNAIEENKKQVHKNQLITKENTKNKDLTSELVNNLINNGSSKKSSSLQLSRKKSSIDNFMTLTDIGSGSIPQHYDIRRMLEIIDTNNKEQQNVILSLEENVRQYKYTIEELYKEFQTATQNGKGNDEKNQSMIEKLTAQLQVLYERMSTTTNDYEDKVTRLQTQINKKQKDIKLNKQTINNLKYEIESIKKRNEIMLSENDASEGRLLNEIEQLSAQVHFLQMSVQNLQQNKKELEEKIFMLEDEISLDRDEILKKDKNSSELNSRYHKLKTQYETVYTHKKELTEQMLSLKEQLNAIKDDNAKTKELLKEEQESKQKLQYFTNSVIKQKQGIVKNEIEASGKVIELQGKIIELKSNIENMGEQIKDKDQQLVHLKNNNREYIQNIKLIQSELSQEKIKIKQLTSKLQEKERKCLEKDSQIKQLTTKYDSLMKKYKKDISVVKEEFEGFSKDSELTNEQKERRIAELQQSVFTLETNIGTMSKELSQNEQTIFFEKQKLSLAESNMNQLKKDNSEAQLVISKLQIEVKNLNDEITLKEESLYEYSGKIYQLQQKIQYQKAQIPIHLEKLDIDWQNRHDEICEEYEQRIEILQKQKNYLTQKLQQQQLEKIKLMEDIRINEENYSKDFQSAQKKEKQSENEKLSKLNQKNKEMEKLKEQVASLNTQMKQQKIEQRKKEEEVKIKEQAIKKLQFKIQDFDVILLNTKDKFESQIEELRSRELVFKNYKEEMRNMQWEVQRQIKKVTQNFIQRIVSSCPEVKEKLVQPIRSFEQSIANSVTFNV